MGNTQQMIANKQKLIDEYFNTKWSFTDFFYAYCEGKDIDDPENDLTEEEYTQLEKECAEKITYGMLRGLREVIIGDINERLEIAMSEQEVNEMRRMNEEELNDEQLEQIDMLDGAARELLSVMSDDEHDGDLADVFALIEYAQELVEKAGYRAHFPAHIFHEDLDYTIDYTDEEIKQEELDGIHKN